MHKKIVLHRHAAYIEPQPTSHGVGEKRVIVTQTDIGRPITQIARTLLYSGEEVIKHLHPTMDEHFFFLTGECSVLIDGIIYNCVAEDYLYIPAGCNHQINAETDTLMITIGVEV
jgi:quercetin dioxygenase-like cupin family protein